MYDVHNVNYICTCNGIIMDLPFLFVISTIFSKGLQQYLQWSVLYLSSLNVVRTVRTLKELYCKTLITYSVIYFTA